MVSNQEILQPSSRKLCYHRTLTTIWSSNGRHRSVGYRSRHLVVISSTKSLKEEGASIPSLKAHHSSPQCHRLHFAASESYPLSFRCRSGRLRPAEWYTVSIELPSSVNSSATNHDGTIDCPIRTAERCIDATAFILANGPPEGV